MRLDQNGLPVTEDMDAGDQLANTSRYLYAAFLNGRREDAMYLALHNHCIPFMGQIRRAPYGFSDFADCGHDQQDPCVIMLEALDENKIHLSVLMQTHKNRTPFGWRYQTVRWATWQQRNYYTPQNRDWRGDALLLFASIVRVIDSYLRPDGSCGPCLNHIMALLQVSKNGHSRWTRIAKWIYCFRKNGPQFAFDWYHRKDLNQIAKEFEPPIKRYIVG